MTGTDETPSGVAGTAGPGALDGGDTPGGTGLSLASLSVGIVVASATPVIVAGRSRPRWPTRR